MGSKTGGLKSVLIGLGGALGITALGLDASVTLSTYGMFLGTFGPFLVIVGIPIFINLVFAYFLLKEAQKATRYSMIGSGIAISLIAGYIAYEQIFIGLMGSA